ncbi:MAG TPA: hypothetical protein VIT45_18395 [Allosphingosinicella sp.]
MVVEPTGKAETTCADNGSSKEYRDFLLEEFKQTYEGIRIHQTMYDRLETYTFAGAVIVYGFLFTTDKELNPLVWYIVPVVLLIAAGRCFGHYTVIAWKNARYLSMIEKEVFGEGMFGFQNFVSSKGFRQLNLLYNIVAWAVLIAAAMTLAAWH